MIDFLQFCSVSDAFKMTREKRFAQIVARYKKLRAQMHESTRQAEMLFQGLLYESFGR